MKKLRLSLLLSVSIIAMLSQITPIIAETPTYVEREKDIYYFKIHGGPYGAPPAAYGRAGFIYKNLASNQQGVKIVLKFIFLTKTMEITKTTPTGTVEAGGEYIDYVPADYGSMVNFTLYVDDSWELTGSIIVPPPSW